MRKAEGDRRKIEILIVEDSPTQAEELRFLLEDNDYTVLAANNGSEALSLLKKKRPNLILSDIVMPEMDGFELCSEIKKDEDLQNIPVVLITALKDPKDVVRGLTCGADNFLTKPYKEGALLSRIHYLLANSEIRREQKAEIGIEILFGGRKYMISSNRMQIIDLLMSTYETAIEKAKENEVLIQELQKSQMQLRTLNEQLEEKVIERTREIEHLNAILMAIRNINQLIVVERDRDRLIQGACDRFIQTQGAESAWICLADEDGKFETAVEAGIGDAFKPMIARMKSGTLPWCVGEAHAQRSVITIEDRSAGCSGCSLENTCKGSGILCSCLEYDGKIYGYLVVSSSPVYLSNEEELSLFKEVAGDISFGLHSIELEEKRKRAQEALQKRTHQLSERVKELNCLYAIANLADKSGYSLAEILQRTVELIPLGMQYSEITCARITFENQVFRTKNFKESPWILAADIVTKSDSAGTLEIYYLEERSESDEGPFAAEERNLINDIAQRLGEIIERRRTGETIKKLSKAVETSGEVVFMTDRDGIFTYVNPEFTDLYGYDSEEVVGKQTPRILKSGNMDPQVYEALWKTLLGKQTIREEIVNITKDGRLISVEGSANPILDDQREIVGFLAIQRDVSDQKRLEEQYRQSQKMEAVGKLAGGIAHDFNNLLTVIGGNASLAMMSLLEDDPIMNDLKHVVSAAEKASKLTKQLLSFSRKQQIQPRVLNVNDVIRGLEKMLPRLITEDISLETYLADDLWDTLIDEGYFEQVILNMCVNARDAIDRGGIISIETKNELLGEKYVSDIPDAEAGNYVRISISDTGSGMTKEIISQIFDPFFTTKPEGEGTGLGLATVYGIVKQSGGFINVYSEPDEGTTFKIYIPKTEESFKAAETKEFTRDQLYGSETILIVEDEEGVRNIAAQMLKKYGYKVIEAENGDAGYMKCKKTTGEIDLIITDVIMPEMNGKEFIENVREFLPDVKVLFMSGYTCDVITRKGIIESEVDFISKPFEPFTLLSKVKEVLELK